MLQQYEKNLIIIRRGGSLHIQPQLGTGATSISGGHFNPEKIQERSSKGPDLNQGRCGSWSVY